ncbi:MAG TPA: polysaccharide biosynthesis/export family protein [Patescibacteria group bacterium]|nr:polysaccharide biosynthesis/export family protein [Patescibacteria group bacterium]
MRVGIYLSVVSLLVFAAPSLHAQRTRQAQVPATVVIQQANQKLESLAQSTAPEQVGEYALGPGDLIKIEVFDIPELSQQIRIDPGGYVTMPLIPQRIRAAGLTPYQFETKIADLLQSKGLVSHPQVTVIVVRRMSQPITVIGAVERPMIYQAQRPTTLLEVLSAAGGLTDTAADYVTVSRMTKSGTSDERRVSLSDLIDRGDPKANIFLHGNDVVSVPKAGVVYVVGAVTRPGGFVIQNDTGEMTALKALALAGGTQPDAKTKNAVIIRKDRLAGKRDELHVNLKKILSQKAEDVPLRPNDILFIPNSAGKKAMAKAVETALSITTGLVIVRGGTF